MLSGLDNGLNYILDDSESQVVNKLPFNPLLNPDQMQQLQIQKDGIQFSHTLEEQIGGQLEAGFLLRDLYEDTNRVGKLHEYGIPSFLATRSRTSWAWGSSSFIRSSITIISVLLQDASVISGTLSRHLSR